METYASINWFVEQEQPGSQSRLRTLVARDLLYQLPFLQRLQRRLLDCVPKGQAARDPVVLVRVCSGAVSLLQHLLSEQGLLRGPLV